MLGDLRHRLRALFRRSAMERELDAELQFHLDHQVEHDARAGIPREEALRRARYELGGIDQVKEACRDERGVGPVDRAGQDFGQAWRILKKHPGFTTTVILTLALGIGATATMFSVVDGVVLRPLPYPQADRIVQIGTSFGGVRVNSLSAPDALDIGRRARTLAHVAATRPLTLDLTGEGAPERLKGAVVSAAYFNVLGVQPAFGQPFSTDLDRPGAPPVAIVSNGLWKRRFTEDPQIIGRQIVLNSVRYSVAGVMPAGFRGPDAISQRDVAIWIPVGRAGSSVSDRGDASWGTIARLADGADESASAAEVDAIASALSAEHRQDARRFWMRPLVAQTVGDRGSQLWLIFAAVGLLWLIACANMANLFLLRATERTREMALRSALGAGRGRVARQLLAESGSCAMAGGLLGTGIAYVCVGLIRSFGPADLPRLEEIAVDGPVIAFTCGLSILAGLGFGLVPALDVMKASSAGDLRGVAATAAGSRVRLRDSLVVLQTALALVLAIGAAVLSHSVMRLSRVNPGFDPRDVVWMDASLPSHAYTTPASRTAFFSELLASVRAMPGVVSAGAIAGRPLGGGNSVSTAFPEGELPAPGVSAPRVPFHSVAPGYFAAMKIPVLDGRDVAESDDAASPRIAVVSRAFAEKFWPGERAIGKRFWMGRVAADAPLTTVVGVVEDVRQYGLDQPPVPIVYRSTAQVPRASLAVVVRHDGRASLSVLRAMRERAWNIDAGLPLDDFGTMNDQVRSSMSEPRFRAAVLSSIGAVAAALALIGLYSTLAWSVRARQREIGIRMTLGAGAGDVRRLVLVRGATLSVIGLGLGAVASIFATRALGSMVFGITPTDPPTLAAAIAGMAAVSMLASWIPARRAATVDPAIVLRVD